MATASTAIATTGEVSFSLVAREHGADREHHHGNEKSVEVALTAEPELVFPRLLPSCPAAAD
jgi:hypothetical protein